MAETVKSSGKSVGLFATCLVDLMRPEVGFASAKLIEDAGFELEVPRSQTCCGQPLYNSGDFQGTRNIARKLIETFTGYDFVVAPSGSCAAMIKIHIPELFSEEADHWYSKAKAIASKTYELTEFLVAFGGSDIATSYISACTYHDSCSGFRELGIHASPRELLGKVEGMTLTECRESTACCGFGGTFCVKYPEISTQIVSEKVQNIQETGAQTVLGGDLGCLMNIAGFLSREGSDIRVLHVAEVLAGCGDNSAIGKPRN